MPKKCPHRAATRSPLEMESLENIQRQNCSSEGCVIQNHRGYGLDYLEPNVLLKGPPMMDNYHVTDSHLNLKEAASEADVTQGKWKEQEG